jgi:hypothetical protein
VRPMPFRERIERRLCECIPVEMQAELLPETHGQRRRAEVLDLSWLGVRIRGERLRLERGDSVDLVIAKGLDWDRRPARVVWLESAGGHALEAGWNSFRGSVRPGWKKIPGGDYSEAFRSPLSFSLPLFSSRKALSPSAESSRRTHCS